MGKRVSTRRIKKDRHYTYQTAADATCVSPRTVMSWRKGGLQVMTASKPHYILGEALIEFHAKRNIQKRGKMDQDQMRCFHCSKPQRPYGGMVDYIPINDVRGRLVGLCEECDQPMGRFASRSALPELARYFDIAIDSGSQA